MGLRVLYSFPLRLGRSGIGEIAYQQAASLVAAGATVLVYAGEIEREVVGAARSVATLDLGFRRLNFERLGTGRAGWIHDWRVAMALPRLRRSVDVIHTWPDGALRTLQMARRLGIPTVLERPNAHTGFAAEVVAEECRRIGYQLPHWHPHNVTPQRLAREEREYRLATRLACPSQFVIDTFRSRGYADEHLALTQYGFDPARFHAHSPEKRAASAGDELRAITVASLEPRKGIHLALEAWCRSSAAASGRIRLYGRLLSDYRSHLEPWIDHPSVVHEGFTDDAPAALREADVMLLPSLEEGSALVTYEAMASGCVLLVSEATGARCRADVEGLVHAPGDVDALTQHINAVAEDRALLARLRAAGIEASKRLAWADSARSLISAYESALRQPRQ